MGGVVRWISLKRPLGPYRPLMVLFYIKDFYPLLCGKIRSSFIRGARSRGINSTLLLKRRSTQLVCLTRYLLRFSKWVFVLVCPPHENLGKKDNRARPFFKA